MAISSAHLPRVVVLATACVWLAALLPAAARQAPAPAPSPMTTLVPVPVSVQPTPGVEFTITKDTRILVRPGTEEMRRIARELTRLLEPAMDAALLVEDAPDGAAAGTIALIVDASNSALGAEGYAIVIARDRVSVTAAAPAGVFYGVQTLRQLLPAAVEHRALRPRPLSLPGGRIEDRPRFAWRGAMLDVARHFFAPRDVRRYIDLLALHKINRLHLHLSDDQGWRLEIKSWPNLARYGGSTEVGGGPGGYYTQDDYAGLVRYAADRFITIVPEIDVPSHINAAMASYPELNCDGQAPPLYTGIEVGFSAMCVDKEITYRFLTDVIREISALTPGPYFHIGGDEVKKLTPEQYQAFIERVLGIVRAHGKQAIGWDEIAKAKRPEGTLVQHWRPDFEHGSEGMPLILSPAHKIYLDMKYDAETAIGLDWAARVKVRDSYEWDPVALAKVPESSIVGIEAPLWSETLATISDVEFMAFPRLAAAAEIAWSPQAARDWTSFRTRLGAQGPRWAALGINFYRSPEVPFE
jgi:hexosaminidase